MIKTIDEAKKYLRNYPCVCQFGMSPYACKDKEGCEFSQAVRLLLGRPTGKCGKCEYYRNNHGYGQCFAQKNAPRVDYNQSCENFKYKEWEGQWVTLRCTNCHERTNLYISSRMGIYSLAEFKKLHFACLKCGADMKVVKQRKENKKNG